MADDHLAKKKGSALVFWLIVGGVVLFVLIAFAGYVVGLRAYSISAEEYTAANQKWSFLGTVGDSFGVINAFFSGSALIGVVVALIYQRRELRHQLDELRESVENQGKQLHYTAQAQHLKTCRELVLLGLGDDRFTSWMGNATWNHKDRFIQLWINHYFLAWQAHDRKLCSGEYWQAMKKEIKDLFQHGDTQTWWASHKAPHYTPQYVNVIDTLIADNNAGDHCS
ncbi:MAG: hypothetical protein KAY37_07920 [Phycisphaerae bacterium]|nr:hypothetical protein [Phycisphaerae bacterium]